MVVIKVLLPRVLSLACLVLVGCANQTPAPQGDGSGYQGRVAPAVVESVDAPTQRTVPQEPGVIKKPRTTAQPVPIQHREAAPKADLPPAARSLHRSALNSFQRGDFSAAIASAERGLRISRTSPELLLVLARSYAQKGNADQARVFAQQGLRYLNNTNRSQKKAFESLLDNLAP
mgnify:CR=1 FL=1